MMNDSSKRERGKILGEFGDQVTMGCNDAMLDAYPSTHTMPSYKG